MAIQSLGQYQSVSRYDSGSVKKTEAEDSTEKAKAANAEKPKQDTFEKSKQYKPDMDKVSAMKADLSNNVAAFKQMVQGIFQKQGGMANNAMNLLLEIDEATQLQAQEAISESGEWGVEQTAERILEFAKALTGGDPSKIGALRDAVEKGFAAAEAVWGGELPEISYQTKERVMEGFREWENGGNSEAAEVAAD